MPIQVSCPSCSRALRVPDALLGQSVKCPGCLTTFSADGGDPPAERRDAYREDLPAREEPPRRPPPEEEPARRPLPRPRLEDEDDEDDDYDLPRRRRWNAPHRGGTVVAIGVLSVVLSLFVCPLIGLMGIAAWTMGHHDLREIRAGRMDPSGEGQTRAGYVLGIIGAVLGGLTVLGTAAFIAVAVMS